MIKLFSKPLLAVLPVLFLIAVASCEKDSSDKKSDKIELLSFGPTGAKHGDTLKFIGTNLDKVTEITFTGEGAVVAQSEFKSRTYGLILLIVPDAAEKGFVTLTTPAGDIVSKTQLNLGVMPTVTGMTGELRPGANVTITGSYLNWVTRITFPKDKEVNSFVSQSFEQIVVTVPADAETGPLMITFSGTDSGFYETEDTVKVILPVVTALAPNPLKHLANITITGTDMDLVRKVHFTNVSAPVTSFESQSATEVVVKVPVGTKKGKIKLEAASGVQTTSAPELDVILPIATSFAPNPADPSTNVTITGTNLDLTSKVFFTGVTDAVTTFVSKTATQLVVTLPPGARKGTVKLEASEVQTTSASELDIVMPTITSFAPGQVDPNANVTITGTRLDRVTAVVLENSAPITTFVSQTPTQIVVKVPVGTANGLITLKVQNSTVTVLSADILQITGTAPPPVIAKHFWDDGLVTANWINGWSGNGWGGTKDVANASPVRIGTKSVRINYDASAYGSPLQLGGADVPLTGVTHFKISIYSTAAAAGNKILIVFNKNETGGGQYELTLGAANQWTDYSIPFSAVPNVTKLVELWVKENQGKAYTIYVDEIGIN